MSYFLLSAADRGTGGGAFRVKPCFIAEGLGSDGGGAPLRSTFTVGAVCKGERGAAGGAFRVVAVAINSWLSDFTVGPVTAAVAINSWLSDFTVRGATAAVNIGDVSPGSTLRDGAHDGRGRDEAGRRGGLLLLLLQELLLGGLLRLSCCTRTSVGGLGACPRALSSM